MDKCAVWTAPICRFLGFLSPPVCSLRRLITVGVSHWEEEHLLKQVEGGIWLAVWHVVHFLPSLSPTQKSRCRAGGNPERITLYRYFLYCFFSWFLWVASEPRIWDLWGLFLSRGGWSGGPPRAWVRLRQTGRGLLAHASHRFEVSRGFGSSDSESKNNFKYG